MRTSDRLQAGGEAPPFMLRNQKGQPRQLADYLAHGPALVAFHRGTW
jgi:peroxiredoxin